MKSVRSMYPPARRTSPAASAAALAAFLAVFALPAAANNFTVTTGTDGAQKSGNTATCIEVDNTDTPTGNGCSLRAAIMLGNNITGPHTITFNPGVTVTVVNGGMAQLRAQFTITGTPVVRTAINGNGHGCLDLTDSGTDQNVPVAIHNGKGATGSTISNLVIGNCSGAGISANGHGYTFNNNYIGVDPTGLVAWPNSGNGIWLSASIAYDDQFIDTNALSNLNLPGQPVSAVDISNFSTGLAGVLVNLQPNTIKDNVISGNTLNGIELFSKTLAATLMSNNMIGTNSTGTLAIANGNNGVHLVGSTFGNLIGPNNVIAGNTQNGIQVDAGAVYLPNFIMGNRIGLSNVNGAHVGNVQSGIYVDTKPSTDPAYLNPSMTGLVIGPLNVIADNQGTNNALNLDDQNDTQGGILITGASTGIKVLGNTIGMAEFPAGTPLASTAYANLGDGIIITTSGNQIGGSAAGSANIVTANARHGIVVRGNATTGNSFLGNSVGVHPSLGGNLALGNGVDGFHIDNASATVIGGSGASDFNTIAANGRNGVKIVNGGTSNGWGNLLQRNRIYHNAVNAATPGVGIDLDRAQNASNPLITGPNEYPANYTNLDQAQPVICTGPGDTGACAGSAAPVSNGSSVTLQWTISTHGPAAHLRMDFFALDTADANTATQFGWYAEQIVDTDANGKPTGANCSNGRCSMQLSGALSGAYLTMTATDITDLTDVPGAPGDWKAGLKCFIGKFGDPTGIISACPANNTSEFSNVASVPALAPSATTNAANNITTTSAQLHGLVNDNGATTAVSFEYGPDTNYGTLATAVPSSVTAGAGNTQIAGPISGLTCGTTYHFRIKASNGIGGIIFGNDLTFDTVACPALAPTVTTAAASNVAVTTATVNGTVSANGASTGVDFVYGTTTAYGLSVNAKAPNPLPANASNAAVTGDLYNLACGTLYHFRVEAANGVGGTQFGNDLTFTTTACPAPNATTLAATNVTTNSITFNGSVNANGNDSTVFFDYGATTAYGSVIAGTPGTVLANAGASAVSATVGAACGTTVHFRVRATNVINTTNGGDLSATLGACGATPPTVSTSAASNITATSATLNGSGNANGFSTTVSWEYGTTASYGQTAPGVPSPLSGSSNTAVTANLSGLTCATTYHFRLDGSNAGGSVNTSDNTFTTSACPAGAPTATTDAASAITATSATLNGTVSSNGAATTVTFNYGGTTSYGAVVVAAQSPLAANASNAPVTYAVSGLSCGLTYHFRVVADNGNGGPVYGSDQSFTTSACAVQPPAATTNAATAVVATSATLNGTVSANGAATTVTFNYGGTTSYGAVMLAAQSPLAANASNAPVSLAIGSLACGQTYHFRVVADNGNGGPVYGGDQTFTTSACVAQAPTATSLAATAIGTTSATINGTINANGAATTVSFAYGATAAYGSTIAAMPASLPANAVGTAVSATLSGLTCATTYHFRVDATNANGPGHGGDLTFATAACPVVTTFTGPTATGTGNATAVLSGGGPTCTLVSPAFVAAPASPPAGVSFPDGLFQFQASGCTGSITLTVTFPSPFMASVQYWKYGPTQAQNSNHWYTLGAANNLSLLANVATFTIADGGLGDDDLSINGTIIDAGGPSITAAVNPQAAVPAPALDVRNLMALIALLAAFGTAVLRSRGKASR